MLINYENYTIDYDLKDNNGYSMKFLVKEIVGWSEDEVTKEWTVPLYGSNLNSDNFEHGDEVVHGFIKWDGCSHWYFSEYQHLCGRSSGLAFAGMITKIFDLARDMEHYADWVAE